jgi:hypothetical protein
MTPHRKSILVVVLGDVACLLFFTIGGVITHEPDSADPIGTVIRTLAPFAIGWFATANAIGVYRSDVIGSPRRALGQTLIATLIATPLAVLLRAVLIGRTAIPASFLAFTLALNTTLFVMWHGGYAGWRARRSRK